MSKLSVETEFDKAVTAVATSLVDCELKKKYGPCNKDSCTRCDMYKYQQNCMNGFADMDKIRVYNIVSHELALRDPPQTKCATGLEATKLKIEYQLRETAMPIIGYIIIIFFFLLLIVAVPSTCCANLYGQSLNDFDFTRYALPTEAPYAGLYRKHILDILDKTYKYVTDINDDGLVNCIDYSITFKRLWDKQYNSKDCEIVRNKSSSMNHLFIRVRQYGGRPWECIEPQAAKKDITKYFMEDFWSSAEYNPLFNIYGETDKWLKEDKHGN